jgi:TolB-like protein/Tfp pilus assembly protein PilF
MEKSKRQLAAIMFTDIVGYTSLMQENERKAKTTRDKHKEVLLEYIKKHHGNILQYYGDGTLSIFSSGVEAVLCAIGIQRKLVNAPKIPLRIGIHIGDIVQEDDGIYGDGVNIASRIESISVPGAVLISDKLQDELGNQPEIKCRSLGNFELKNVKKLVEIFAIIDEGIKVPSAKELKLDKARAAKSIAVLPFVNMSADKENEYFSDGITEEILNALVKVDGLQVTSRTSSFVFKNKSIDAREIANQLSVNTILEGSVRKAGNKVRITAQLINSADGYHIWSDVYDRNLEDIFEVQDEIASKIANTLREKLTGKEKKEHLVTTATQNLEAYNLYLKGKFNLYNWTPESGKRGIEYLEKAIAKEPDFALAHSTLAFGYTLLGVIGSIPSKIAFPRAKELADRAIKLNNQSATAHSSLGLINIFVHWDLDGAYQSFQTALEHSSGSGEIYHAYYIYLTAVGKSDEAVNTMERAIQLDPLSLPINQSLGEALMNAGRYDDAIEQLDKTLELDPNFRAAIETKGWAYLFKNEKERAIDTFKEFQMKTGDPLKGQTGLGYTYGVAGKIDKANECLQLLSQREKRDTNVNLNMDFLVIYAGLNDLDKVFYYMGKALDEGSVLMFLRTHPFAENIRNDPRFNELLIKAGFKV